MALRLEVHNEKNWNKDLKVLPKGLYEHMIPVIRKLIEQPWPRELHIIKLGRNDLADYRLRIGNYRIFFDWMKETNSIRLYRLLRRDSKLYHRLFH